MLDSPDSNTPNQFSRRDFLKTAGGLAATTVADALLFGGAVAIEEKMMFSEKHKINMNNYLLKCQIPDPHYYAENDKRPEAKYGYAINYPALKLLFPDVVKDSENGGHLFSNTTENQVELDFSGAMDKEIVFFPNQVEVAKSNMSWDKAKNAESFGSVSSGLVLEGAFKVKGDIGHPPIFLGDNLDRVIMFKGSGKEKCLVEDIYLKGNLSAYKQDNDGGETVLNLYL